jgi:phospholipid/cholesterol/gamma-HCH transport system substrate-binding protein
LKGFSKEVRVGILLLIAGILMGGFVFILAGVSLKGGYVVYVDFNNPGSLKAGAPIRIAGVHAGMVESIQYLGGRLDPVTGRRPLVRAQIKLHDDVKETVHTDSRFYVTSAGILGEPFMALEPGTEGKPVLSEGAITVGIDPPRLDQALNMGYELLETMVSGVRNNRDEIADLVHDTGGMIKGLNTRIGENGTKLDDLVAKVETMSSEGTTWIKGIRTDYVEGPKVKNLVNTVDKAMQEATPLVKEVRATVNDVFGAEQRGQLKETISDVAALADRSKVNLADANKMLGEMKRGEGTAGQLLMNVEMSDDFQEWLDDLKRKPWKLFWRE